MSLDDWCRFCFVNFNEGDDWRRCIRVVQRFQNCETVKTRSNIHAMFGLKKRRQAPHSKAINVWSDDLTIITPRSRYRAAVICVTLGEG